MTSLRTIIDALQERGLLVEVTADAGNVKGVTDDSRAVRNGDLYCAWRGTTRDSHEFAAGAADQGASALLVEHQVSGINLPQIVVRDGRRGAAVAADIVFGNPSRQLTVLGVTGTNGKTTTAWIMRHLLSVRYSAALIGTLGIFLADGKPLQAESLTTPGPVELARVLSQLVQRGVTAISMEVSSHALDQGRVHALAFDAAVFTNLTRDHLDYHGTLEAYLAAKQSFIDLIRDGGTAIINADDVAWNGLEQRAKRTLRFGVARNDADVSAQDVDFRADGTRFVLSYDGRSAPVELPLLGDYNVQNALGAAAACLSLGYALDEVAELLGTVPQVPGRLEKVHTARFTVLRDYAHTPDALERVLHTLRDVVSGRIIAVFGAGGDRDKGKRPEMGQIAQRLADVAIVTSDNPRTESPEAIIDDIVAGMQSGQYARIVNRREAIAEALRSARPGDVVLLAGKGHETYQIIGSQKLDFDERAIVADLMANTEVGA
ncbi:MAG TPA: UDP-N-acetylmuramoyl-L-alanyl-D-glutamate--2,6-diaminopimelate ligase [Longimicrobiales bacterium]|nr:UDP-N-acetylmuramoyl-L-alanyl-D-glutamate--2,6-diaminopimelate ligase [Longimicrobiales bacterium]